MNFLNYDSPFMAALRKYVDYILLGIMWLFVSLAAVTFGAATTAMLYTAEKSIRQDEGKMFVTFWKCFAREFKQATVLWLLGALFSSFLTFNVILLWGVELPGLVFALVLVASIIIFAWISLWFGYLSRFKDTIRMILNNTFRMVFAYLPRVMLLTIVTAAAIAAIVLAVLYMPPIALFVPGVYTMLANSIYRKIFKSYLPDDDNYPLT